METLTRCRICLIKDVRRYCLVNTDLQEIYELLTGKLLETRDRRPVEACYVCCARLRKCLQLRRASLHSEELFTHLLDKDDFDVKPIRVLRNLCTVSLTPVSLGAVVHRELQPKPEPSPTTGGQLDEEHVGVTDLEDNIVEQGMCTQLIQQQQHIKCEEVTLVDDYSIPNVEEDSNSASNDYCLEDDPLESGTLKSDHSISSVNLQHKYNKTVKIVLHQLELNTFGRVADIKKLKPADLEDTSQSTIGDKPENEQITKPNICEEYKNIAHVPTAIHCTLNSDSVKLNKCYTFRKDLGKKHTLSSYARSTTGRKVNAFGNSFKQKSNLLSRRRTHSDKRVYTCGTCGKGFSVKGNLSVHMRIHTGEKPYACSTCGKSFCHYRSFSDHIRTHTGEKPHKCSTCEKCFTQKNSLTAHIRIHTGEKPYKCKICKKCFTQKQTLTAHLRTHTGEKPYKCDICEKSFSLKHTLTLHIRIHIGEKLYKCDLCGKGFITKCHLSRHIGIHVGEKLIKSAVKSRISKLLC